jgi:hypothetical protein
MADTKPPEPEIVRRQLIALVRQKGKRKQEWSLERPSDWRPVDVRDEFGAMTNLRAWQAILQWLEDGCAIVSKQMELPNGKSVWVHVMLGQLGDLKVYVKLEILGGGRFVFGWSFHPSERPDSGAKDNEKDEGQSGR